MMPATDSGDVFSDDVSSGSSSGHVPVLLDRVLALLAPALTDHPSVVVDATLGLGGHAQALLAAHPQLTLVGLDRDPDALRRSGERLATYTSRLHLVHAVYDELPAVLADLGLAHVDGVLFDLGVSSMQLDQTERGFSYARDAPLDMRMDQSSGLTAADVLNTYSVRELARILSQFGEERFALRVAQAIGRERSTAPLTSTARLADLVRDAIPAATRRTGGHPAKRTFQALRIEVNGELDALDGALRAALDAISIGGRVVAMSYHSLEDRLVKTAVRGTGRRSDPTGPTRSAAVGRSAVATAHSRRRSGVSGRDRGKPARGLRAVARRGTDPGAGMRTITERTEPASTSGPGERGAPRRAPFILLVLGLIGAGLCALLAINTVAAADEVRQRDLTSSNDDASNQIQQLKIDIANKQAPAALASAARALGMVPDPNPAFLVLSPNGTVTVAGSAVKVPGKAVATPTPTPTPRSLVSPDVTAPSTSPSAAPRRRPLRVGRAGSDDGCPAPTTVAITGAR